MLPGELTDLEIARRLVLERVTPLRAEPVPLAKALGRTLAADVESVDPVPPFDNSAMDGYAVRVADVDGADERPVSLTVVDESRAGHPAARTLGPDEAISISTGAQVPNGADAVVRIEDTREENGRVQVRARVEPAQNIRRAGEDVRAGEPVLDCGTRLGAAELGVLASVGVARPRCARRPSVVVLTTGDELLDPEDPLRPGAVRNSSAFTVPAQALGAGARVERVAAVSDDPGETLDAISEALPSDAVIVCGGVSVGRHDHVKSALAELRVEEIFWGIALRPGKPTWFGTCERTGEGSPGPTLVFGLPGNPVSAMITFQLLTRPALLAMQGASERAQRASAVLEEPYPKRPGRTHCVRVRLDLQDDGWHARPTKEQGSHVLTSMLGADALAVIPAERGNVEAGERVEIELFPGLTAVLP
jgi:molybdopterin molybdotransferase